MTEVEAERLARKIDQLATVLRAKDPVAALALWTFEFKRALIVQSQEDEKRITLAKAVGRERELHCRQTKKEA